MRGPATMSSAYSYVGSVNTNLICCVCQAPFLVPTVTTTCFHTFCRDCIVRSLETQQCCPIDRSPLTLADLKPENLLLKNMVDELVVECSQKSMGCKHTCQRQLLNSHLKEFCQYVQVPCSEDGCKQMVLRKDLGKHLHDCIHRLVFCETCGISMRASDFESHGTDCLQQDTVCSACSGALKRSNLPQHLSTCEAIEVNCEHSPHGCEWVGPRRNSPMHLRRCPYEAIKGFFSVNQSKIATLHDENCILRQKLDNAEAIIHSLKREAEIARRALGPWWKPNIQGSTSHAANSSALPAHGPETHNSSRSPESLRPRTLDASIPLETTSVYSGPEIDSIDRAVDPLADPAFVASFFPSNPVNVRATEYSNPSGHHTSALAAQWDPMTRQLFPLYSRSALCLPSRLRFPELSFVPGTIVMQQHQHENEAHQQQQQQQAQQGQTSARAPVAPVDRSASLEDALCGLRESVVELQATLDSLARRTDVALATENLRMNEEVGVLRAVVHGLRMQVHALITERNGHGHGHGWALSPVLPPPVVGGGLGAGIAATASPAPQPPQTTKL